MKVGGGSMAKQRAQAGHADIHGNSESGNHPPDTITLTKSVEILANPTLTNSTNEGERVREKTATHTQLERMIRETGESPICNIMVHGLLITVDQHWLDFNLA